MAVNWIKFRGMKMLREVKVYTYRFLARVMTYLYFRTQTRVPTGIQIPNLIATLWYAEHVHVARNQIQIPI